LIGRLSPGSCYSGAGGSKYLPSTIQSRAIRRDIMGDRGGKKDKEKGKKQNSDKQQQKAKNKVARQPKRKP
jgi:uncharacterized protein YaiI (UPF0178 family)